MRITEGLALEDARHRRHAEAGAASSTGGGVAQWYTPY
jgi:hypothetical protein